MRGFRMGGVIAGALAAVSLGIMHSLDFRVRQAQPPKKPRPLAAARTNRTGKYAWSPEGKSGQDPQRGTRLLADRASNVRKIKRWRRAGLIDEPAHKDDRHLLRHGWYRRQLEKQARAAATEAWSAPA